VLFRSQHKCPSRHEMDAWLTPTGEMEPMEASFWNDKRPNGVSNDIDLSQFGSILEVFDASCATHADRPAFTTMGVTLTWGAIERCSAAFAGYMRRFADLKPGGRIASQMPNVLEFPVAVFGAVRAGLVVVNANPLYPAREMRHQFTASGARALIYMNIFGHLVQQV